MLWSLISEANYVVWQPMNFKIHGKIDILVWFVGLQCMWFFLVTMQVLLGRATEDVIVDIDLGREGHANIISRRQVRFAQVYQCILIVMVVAYSCFLFFFFFVLKFVELCIQSLFLSVLYLHFFTFFLSLQGFVAFLSNTITIYYMN